MDREPSQPSPGGPVPGGSGSEEPGLAVVRGDAGLG